MCRKTIKSAERIASWRDISDAIEEARNIFDMATHDARDKTSRKKVWQLLVTAQEIAKSESSYCQMEDYNGCFIPSLRKIFARVKI